MEQDQSISWDIPVENTRSHHPYQYKHNNTNTHTDTDQQIPQFSDKSTHNHHNHSIMHSNQHTPSKRSYVQAQDSQNLHQNSQSKHQNDRYEKGDGNTNYNNDRGDNGHSNKNYQINSNHSNHSNHSHSSNRHYNSTKKQYPSEGSNRYNKQHDNRERRNQHQRLQHQQKYNKPKPGDENFDPKFNTFHHDHKKVKYNHTKSHELATLTTDNTNTGGDNFSTNLSFNPIKLESDPQRLATRKKQLDIVFNSSYYKLYTTLVPKESREDELRNSLHPQTPNHRHIYSKRQWDGHFNSWRRRLSFYQEGVTETDLLEAQRHSFDAASRILDAQLEASDGVNISPHFITNAITSAAIEGGFIRPKELTNHQRMALESNSNSVDVIADDQVEEYQQAFEGEGEMDNINVQQQTEIQANNSEIYDQQQSSNVSHIEEEEPLEYEDEEAMAIALALANEME